MQIVGHSVFFGLVFAFIVVVIRLGRKMEPYDTKLNESFPTGTVLDVLEPAETTDRSPDPMLGTWAIDKTQRRFM